MIKEIDYYYSYSDNIFKYESIYDAKGNKTVYAEYSWDNETQNWVSVYKVESAYNADGNPTVQVGYDWYETQFSFKYEYAYDADGNQTMYTIYDWNSNKNDWEVSQIVIYEIQTVNTGINNVQVATAKVYPNPTSGMLYVETANGTVPALTLYSLQGKQFLQTTGNEVDLSAYPRGIYLLQVDGEVVKVMRK